MSDIFKDIAADIQAVVEERAEDQFTDFGAKIRRLIREIDGGRPSDECNAAYVAMMAAVELYRPIILAKVKRRLHHRALAVLTDGG